MTFNKDDLFFLEAVDRFYCGNICDIHIYHMAAWFLLLLYSFYSGKYVFDSVIYPLLQIKITINVKTQMLSR